MSQGARAWLREAGQRLYPYRPRFEDRRFWAIQGLILLVAALHVAIELRRPPGVIDHMEVVPIALFFVPVVYAALNFGFPGTVATALWCTVLAIPNVVLLHEGLDRVGELVQIGAVDGVALFVGLRVERERRAREETEAATGALRASEERYRGLFESNQAAVLVLDQAGAVLDANPAAGKMFGRPASALGGLAFTELVGTAGRSLLESAADGNAPRSHLVLRWGNRSEVHLEPTVARIGEGRGEPVVQVLLRDVTEERNRQAGLRAYAAHVLRAQEEERQRIAQELHDQIVQALILLCRRLDAAEGACAEGGCGAPVKAAGELRAARKTAEEMIEGLRDFAGALRPPTLDDLGLAVSVRKLLEDLTSSAAVKGQFKVVGAERRVCADTELSLFRIAQEALRNVERHARAAHVAVILDYEADVVRLDVLDDGVGFQPADAWDGSIAGGHLGLVGMKERAELLGGTLQIQAGPGSGTRVTATVPVASSTLEAASESEGR